MWSDFHSDRRISYYLFLRRGYGYSATEAHASVKRIDAMVVGLQHLSREHRWRGFLVALLVRLIPWIGTKCFLTSELDRHKQDSRCAGS